ALVAADREHPGVLAGAVVLDAARRPALLLAALEVVLGGRRLRQQAPDRLELRRLGVVRGARDRDFELLEIGSRAYKRQRLDRLRSGAQEGYEARIAGDREDRAIPKGNGVDALDGLDNPAAAH